MPEILHEVTIEGSPDKIVKALTEQAGIARWWTMDNQTEPQVGSVAKFRFYGGQAEFHMKVTDIADDRVYWSVQAGPPGWENTRVTWDLAPAENGTNVLLGHRDWASTEGLYPSTSYNWAWYLTSLKDYIETGAGRPHTGS